MATTISPGRANSPKLTANIADHATIAGGRGLVFDGVTDYLEFDQINQEASPNYTLSFWANITQTPSGGYEAMIFGGGGSDYQGIAFTTSNKLYIRLRGSGWAIDDANIVTNVSTGTWNHYVIAISSSNYSVYLNGIQIHSTNVTLTSMDTSHGFKYIGKGASGFYNGKLSDLKFFNGIVATEAQVQELYLKPESMPSALKDYCVLWYPMCEGNPESPQSIVYDHSERGLGTQKFINSTFDGNVTYWLTSNSNSTQSYNSDTGHYRQVVSADNGYWWLHWNQPHTFSDFGLFEAKVHFVSGNPYQVKFQLRDASGTYHTKYSPELSSVGDSYHFKYYINGLNSYGDQRFYLTNAEDGDTVDWEFVKFTPINMGNHATTNFFGDELVDTNARTFESTSTYGWAAYGSNTIANDSNTLKITRVDNNQGAYLYLRDATDLTTNLTVGRTYLLKADFLTTDASKTFTARLSNSGGTDIAYDSLNNTSFVTKEFQFVAGHATNAFLVVENMATDGIVKVDNLTLKEVGISSSGFATADSEPTIPQVPLMRYNEKMLFDGVDDKVTLGSTLTIASAGGQGSVSAVVNISQIDSNYRMIFGGTHPNLFAYMGYYSNNFKWLIDGAWNTSSTQIVAGKTYHIVGTWNNTSYKFYVNGVLDWSITDSGVLADFNTIGDSPNYEEHHGIIDEVSTWNVELTSTQVQELFNDGVALDATTHSKVANLIGYWRNDGVSTWTDRSTNSNHGTVSGTPESIIVREGLNSNKDGLGFPFKWDTKNCFRIPSDTRSGTDPTALVIPDSEPFNPHTGSFSIEFWVRSEETNQIEIIEKQGTGGGYQFIANSSSGKIRWEIWDADGVGGVTMDTTSDFNDGDWHHIVGIRDYDTSGGIMQIWFDGSQEGSNADASGIDDVKPASDIWIGGGNTALVFRGIVDEVRYYSKALSSAEISKNYKHGKGKHKNS